MVQSGELLRCTIENGAVVAPPSGRFPPEQGGRRAQGRGQCSWQAVTLQAQPGGKMGSRGCRIWTSAQARGSDATACQGLPVKSDPDRRRGMHAIRMTING
jgi:hypothetical protein